MDKSEFDARLEHQRQEREKRKQERSLKAKARIEKKKLEEPQTAIAPIPVEPVPEQFKEHLWKPGQSGNPSGRPKSKPMKEAAEKVFLAGAKGEDRNQLEKMLRLVKDKMIKFLEDDDIDVDDLHTLVQDIEVIATRLEGKPAQEKEEGDIGHGPLIINIGTRFAPPKQEAIDVEVVTNG